MKICSTQWTIFLGILLSLVLGKNLECISTNQCNCFRLGGNEYEFQCPPNDFKIVFHTTPGQNVKIDCYDLPEFDINVFPDIDVGDLDFFQMRFCPLPNDSFSTMLEKYNISSIKSMMLEEIPKTEDEKAVTKYLFDGLSSLEKLSIRLLGIKLEENAFESLPNLIQLYLENSEIHEIGKNMFRYTPKLQVLHLTRNNISYIPDGLFQNLSNLQQLHLWRNELTSLDKNAFMSLTKLKSLELSLNKIKFLDEDSFSKLTELVNISLKSNNLHVVPSNIFKYNAALQNIRIGNNPNLNLSDYVFANLSQLVNLNIDNANLETLPEHIFEGSYNIVEVSLKSNNIRELPKNVFKDMIKLKKLHLEGNRLKFLPNEIFSSLKNMEQLNLEGNSFTEINGELFSNTQSLQTLSLRYNRISTINLNAFIQLRKLTALDLSYNEYSLKYGENLEGLNPFSNCEQLRELNLSHNLIGTFPESIIENKVYLMYLDLDNNKINELRVASLMKVSQYKVEVYLNNNNISVVNFQDIIRASRALDPRNYDAAHNTNSSTIVYISHNPIRCDCINFNLVQYNNDKLDPIIKTLVDIKMDNLQCETPESYRNIFVSELQPYQISCPLEKHCPEKCACSYRQFDQCAVVDCSYRNLTNAPKIILVEPFIKQIEVNLQGNELETTPIHGIGYDNVTRLDLSDNRIKNISWIPPRIQILQLNGNQLRHVDHNILEYLNASSTLENLTLYGNPWKCDCLALGLQTYLRSHFTKVKISDVICENNRELLINRKELCKSYVTIAMTIATPILVVLFAMAVGMAMYLFYREEIKIWLYAKNLCLWFVTEEELDKDKTYDIFISYSHKDEEFVIHNLLPVLESGPNPFKVCIHIRDWVPGEFIATQVTNSVLDSRRTLVILSDSFLESVWGKMEFRTAHTQAINEGRARVIVVKYGKLDEEKLDSELKSYLKTNTYVEWGDPWFWNKLKYALPHSRKNKFYNNNQKHANMMLKIDDKFELVTSSPTAHVESTPPVISLDPSLLKNHPLNFKHSDSIVTPPAEGPLIKR